MWVLQGKVGVKDRGANDSSGLEARIASLSCFSEHEACSAFLFQAKSCSFHLCCCNSYCSPLEEQVPSVGDVS
jgi:hypothetical protein